MQLGNMGLSMGLGMSKQGVLNAPVPWFLSPAYKLSDTSPSIYLDFANKRYAANAVENEITNIVSFSRSTSQSYYDSDGVRKVAAINTPAISYDQLTGEPLGVQSFGGATNLATYSEDFSQSSMWVTARVSLSSGITSKDGVTPATKFAATAVLGSHEITQASMPITSGVTYTHVLEVHADEYSRLWCEPYAGRYGTGSGNYYFDLKKGVITEIVAATGVIDKGIIPLGDDWFLVFISMTASVTHSDGRVWFGILDNSNNKSFTGNGTSGITIANYSIYTGQKGLVPYIKTTGTSLTSGADSIEFTASSPVTLGDCYDSTKGTAIVEFMTHTKGTTNNRGAFSFNNGATSQYIDTSFSDGASDLIFTNIYNSTTQFSGSFSYYQPFLKSTVAMAWEANNANSARDGKLSTLDTSVSVPSGITRLQIGINRSGDILNGYIQEFRYYPVRATDTEIKNASNKFGMADSLRTATTAIAFGDSITQATGTFGMGSMQYPAILAQALGITITNSGVSGTPLQNTNRTPEGTPFPNNGRDRYVSSLTGGSKKDVAIIMYGTNDLGLTLQTNWSLALYINDYQEIITGLIGAGYAADDIILCSPPYIKTYNWGATFTGSNQTIHETYVAAVKQLAKDNGCLYAATYEATKAIGDASSYDGLHPNAMTNGQVFSNEIMKATLQ